MNLNDGYCLKKINREREGTNWQCWARREEINARRLKWTRAIDGVSSIIKWLNAVATNKTWSIHATDVFNVIEYRRDALFRWRKRDTSPYLTLSPVNNPTRIRKFTSCIRVTDYQFPIDVSGVAKDHPFLEADSLQSLFRRLHALNRCANMKLDTHHHTHHSTSHSKSVSTLLL